MALFFNQMQKLSKTPLLIGADFERGSSMRVSDTVRYPVQHGIRRGARCGGFARRKDWRRRAKRARLACSGSSLRTRTSTIIR